MAEDSMVNVKMLFEIITDKEFEELKERAIRVFCTRSEKRTFLA
jgi:hypothetical protein